MNVFSKALDLSFSSEKEEENMGSNSKISTTSRVTINRLSLKKISFIKLLIAFSASIPEEKAYTMS